MKLPEMKTGLTISALVHAALLLWGLISFSARPLEAAPKDALPVDIISDKEFSELTKGVKNAPMIEASKAPVEKIDEPKPAEDATAKVKDKPEIKTAAAEPPPPPMPEPRPAETKPEKKPPPKVDPIAEALKKDEAKRKAEEKAKAKHKPTPPQPRFDPTQIAALLDKRDPQRRAATGEALVPVPGLGVPTGSAAKLSKSELDALRERLIQLWNPPVGAEKPDELIVTVTIRLNRDRRLAAPPFARAKSNSPAGQASRDSAVRAILAGQPFDMLKPEHYELWKEIEITFDPRDMIRG